VVLAEKALGGPAALRATPFQRVAGGAGRVVNVPARYAAHTLDRVVGTAQRAGGQTGGVLTSVVGAVRDTLGAGRPATLRRAEQVAEAEGDTAVAEAVAATRRELGDVDAAELPVAGYDAMTTAQVAEAVEQLRTPEEVRTVIRYEETHRARTSVVSAVQARPAELAKEALGVPERSSAPARAHPVPGRSRAAPTGGPERDLRHSALRTAESGKCWSS